MEIWKPIEGTDGRLEISSYGRVKSNLRDGRILKATPDAKGYLRLRVTLDRVKMSYKIHRIVAQTFIENPDNLPQVNHIDGDKTNNHVENLEWVSNIDNAHHAISKGLWDNVFIAAKRANMKIRTPIVATCIATGETIAFRSVSDAERALGTRHISDVLNGKRAKAKGYTFERR